MIPVDVAGQRLDKVLASLFPPYSRSQLQGWLREGRMTMEGLIPSQRQIVRGGERLHLLVPKEAPHEWQPQPLPLQVVYEDCEIVVIDKPAGLVGEALVELSWGGGCCRAEGWRRASDGAQLERRVLPG